MGITHGSPCNFLAFKIASLPLQDQRQTLSLFLTNHFLLILLLLLLHFSFHMLLIQYCMVMGFCSFPAFWSYHVGSGTALLERPHGKPWHYMERQRTGEPSLPVKTHFGSGSSSLSDFGWQHVDQKEKKKKAQVSPSQSLDSQNCQQIKLLY